MKTIRLIPFLMAMLMVVLLASCGPSYVGVGTRPAYGYYNGYARPYPYYGNYGNYGGNYRSYGGYYRPPVVVQRRTYVAPAPRYSAPRSYSPNGRAGGNFGGGGGSRSRGPR